MLQFHIRYQIRSLLFLSFFLITQGGLASTINIGWEAPVRSFDPRQNLDANSQYLESLVHCSLVEFDQEGSTTLSLADKATWSEDGLSLTMQIKDKALFSNGDNVTAKDVAATYQSLIANPSFARHSSFKGIRSITTNQDDKVIFNLTEQDATFLSNLVVGIIPSKLAQSKDKLSFKVPGCGPFVITSKSIGGIMLKANPHYKMGPAPSTDQIFIKIVKSEKTRLAKLRTGELDIVQNLIGRHLVQTIEKRYPRLKVQKKPALKTSYIGFNTKDPILKNRLVRQGISYAIDRQPIIHHILADLAVPAMTLLPPRSAYFNENIKKINFDLKKANKLLDEAGFPKKGDHRFVLSYKVTTDATSLQIAKAIASQLKKVGIKVKVESMEWGRFAQDIAAGRAQMWGLKWIGFKDPDIYRYAFSTESIPPQGGNRGHYSNPELDQLLEKGRKTLDSEKRRMVYNKVQDIIAHDCPYVFLWHEENFAIVNKKLEGFKLYADGRLNSLTQVTKK